MWELFKNWIFDVIQFFYNFCGDWGMAIIIITIIFRILVSPLMHHQAKSNYQMQKIQPRLKSLQERFADDPVRQQEEMQKLYAEAKFNPLAGCLPMFLQMPIFIALFQVLQEMPTRIGDTTTYEFYHIVPNLVLSPGSAISQGFLVAIPYFVLLIVFAGATFAPMLIQQRGNSDSQQRNQMLLTTGIMSIFMLWIGWGSPAGVLLFWGASSLLGIAQNQLSIRHIKKKETAEAPVEVKPIEVDVTRKAKKPRPKKKR